MIMDPSGTSSVEGFDGEPFDPLRWTTPEPLRVPGIADHVAPPPAARLMVIAGGNGEIASNGRPLGQALRDLRNGVFNSHEAMLVAQDALAKLTVARCGDTVRRPGRGGGTALPSRFLNAAARSSTNVVGLAGADWHEMPRGNAAPEVERNAVPGRVRLGLAAEAKVPVSAEESFKPLARTSISRLGAADLDRLGQGDVAAVFGAAYDQDGCNPGIRLIESGFPLLEVTELSLRGGPIGRGLLRADCRLVTSSTLGDNHGHDNHGHDNHGHDNHGHDNHGELTASWCHAAVSQGARCLAMYFGLHLCLAGARFLDDAAGDLHLAESAGRWTTAKVAQLRVDVTGMGLLPRPWLTVDAEVSVGPEVVARLRGLALEVRERDGASIGLAQGGTVPSFLGRKNGAGQPAVLNELHMAHFAQGDQGLALGPEFAAYTGRRATRLPSGGLLLVDRVMELYVRRGDLKGGAAHVTEYDSPADAWYYRDTANASMPNCIYMETSLQSALMVGYFAGATLQDPGTDYSLRNLGGKATLRRQIDLRDKTIRQHSTLLSTTSMPGSILQSFAYRLTVDGEELYDGESMFGYFSQSALANQTGLDSGRYVGPWLDGAQPPPVVRTVDIAARRDRGGGPASSRGHLALLDGIQVVDDGGRFGAGYLYAARRTDPDAWFFRRHFRFDPVVPGSFGVEQVIQAMQEWLVDGGYADGLIEPAFVVPVGLTLQWKYRGQILSTDAETTLEVHLKSVERRPGRVRLVGDASVWKPGLRIYELTDVAVELCDRDAPSW